MTVEHRSQIVTGDFVGSAWDTNPEWTPYAQGIADSYPVQVPWYLSQTIAMPQTLGGLFPQFRAAKTRPQQFDILIMGAALEADFTDYYTNLSVNNLSIQIAHDQTGIPWVDPTFVSFTPVLSLGGLSTTLVPGAPIRPKMPILRLPDAFFLPRNTRLELMWTQYTSAPMPAVTVVLTFVGVQLMRDGPAPEFVTLPNGQTIRVGSRIPWFGVVPYGRRQTNARVFGDVTLRAGEQIMQFLPPADCNIELHDTYVNFTAGFTNSQNFAAKLSNMRARNDWTPGLAPLMSVAHDELKNNPALPFCRPYTLEAQHRMGIVEQNNSTVNSPIGGVITFRGVRRCMF